MQRGEQGSKLAAQHWNGAGKLLYYPDMWRWIYTAARGKRAISSSITLALSPDFQTKPLNLVLGKSPSAKRTGDRRHYLNCGLLLGGLLLGCPAVTITQSSKHYVIPSGSAFQAGELCLYWYLNQPFCLSARTCKDISTS